MAAVAGLVIAGIVALVLVLGGDDNPAGSNQLAAAAGCDPVENPPLLDAKHINPPATATYNTNPPASGNHYNAPGGAGPVTSGIHRGPVQYEGSTHNLEHSGIVIFYKESVGRSIADDLAEVVRSDPQWITLAPNPTLPSEVAFTAWGRLQECRTPNEQGIKAVAEDFVKRFRGKGPENVPGTVEPGTATATPPASATQSPSGSLSPSPSPTVTGT